MPKSFVLMTALPPTKGHLDLIEFATHLTGRVIVLVGTQPGEPFPFQRVAAIEEAVSGAKMWEVRVRHLHQELAQEPDPHNPEPFWEMWRGIMEHYGFKEGDYIVSSETYGLELAQATGGVFMPYDLNRLVRYTKGTLVREDFVEHQDYILPEFMKFLRRSVTFFGAESVGKSTTSTAVADKLKATPSPEWARPYLEAVGPEVTLEKMRRIYEGQTALQEKVLSNEETVYVIQDTDLFSTVGYWKMWDPDTVPEELIKDARELRSHLYIILSSDIPFEKDPLRYGGDSRESSDQYWIDLCEEYKLDYVYITDTEDRAAASLRAIEQFFGPSPLIYKRVGKEYERGV